MSELPPEPTRPDQSAPAAPAAPAPAPATPSAPVTPAAPFDIQYETPPPGGNARTLVRLAGIFGLISCGIDLLYGLGMNGVSIALYFFFRTAIAAAAAAPAAPGAPPPPPPPPPGTIWMMVATYAVPGILSLLVIAPKLIGATTLLRRGKRAWGWGLAMGIICCAQLWMFQPCCIPYILPLAVGIYTIVILCLPQVRSFLSASEGASWR